MKMRVILSGGGTGGHVNPALSIGSAIMLSNPDVELHYVGTPSGIENKLVPGNYTMHHVEIRGLRRSLSPRNIKTAFLTVTAFNKAKKLLKELKPDAVIGTGGYVCWPICAAAASMNIPCFLHESNAVPGFAVKMLEKKADVIFVNFADTAKQLPKAREVVHVGTPLRKEFYELDRSGARKRLSVAPCYKKTVLSFGGSLGAARVNREILSVMKTYGKEHKDVLFLHATGAREYETFKRAFKDAGLEGCENLRFSEYIYDMPVHMAAADLVICRSGAMTLSELSVLGKPSILIPSPNVTNDQQTKNAKLLSSGGAAILLSEEELTEEKLAKNVEELLSDDKKSEEMAAKVRTFAVKDAEKVISQKISEVIEEKRKIYKSHKG